MAETSGVIQRLKWLLPSRVLLVALGPTPTAVQLFLLTFDTSDAADLARKKAVGDLLGRAFGAKLPVSLFHGPNDALITGVDVRFAAVRVDGVEATQSIQDLNQSVPLIALKSTVARVYLSSTLAAPITVRGTLWIRRLSDGTGRVLGSLNSVLLDPAQFGQVDAQRRNVAGSLNFALPPELVTAGDLVVALMTLTDTMSNQPVDFAPPGDLTTVSFVNSPPLRLRLIGFSYAQGTPPQTFTPRALDFGLTVSWLQRAYPVALVIASQSVAPANAAVPFGCGDINTQVAALRALDMSAGADRRTHYYGMVSDGGFFMRGCAGVPSTPDPSAVGSGPSGSASWGWDFDGSYADWYCGHELGHTFGRKHPGFCGESHDDPSYPFIAGQLANADDAFVGFDVGDAAYGLAMAALPGTDWHDVMTYCSTQWLSSYTYTGIRARLIAEDALGSGGGGSGRPDERFPAGFEREGQATPHTLVSLIAELNLRRETGRIAYILPISAGRMTPPDPDSPVMIRTARGNNETLAEFRVPVKPFSDEDPNEVGHALCDVIIAVHPDAAVIELYLKGQLVDTRRRSRVAPVVPEVRILGFDAGGLTLGWGDEADRDEAHSYSVQLSDDNGRSWRTVAVGLTTRRVTIHPDNVPPNRRVLVRVQATDGFRSAERIVEWAVPARP